MLRIGFIRHAKTSWNLEKRIQGSSDIPLSQEGIKQARAWADAGLLKHYDRILSSPMARAGQTARIIAQETGLFAEYDPGLREQDFGQWEGKKISDIRNSSPGEIEQQESRGWEFTPPGGESRIRVLNRAIAAIERAAQKYDGGTLLVVSHSSVIKTVLYKALGRKFLPGEPKILKAYHLHEMAWDGAFFVENLNHIDLS